MDSLKATIFLCSMFWMMFLMSIWHPSRATDAIVTLLCIIQFSFAVYYFYKSFKNKE